MTIGARRSIASATAALLGNRRRQPRGRARRGRGCWSGRLPPHRCDPAADVSARATTTADTESPQLFGHVRLWWALVDEHRAVRHLQQGGISLADVEERDAQPCGRPDARVGRRAQASATRATTAARTATARDRRATTIAAATSSPPESTVSVETLRVRQRRDARAHTTRYAASHPSSQLSSAATSARTGGARRIEGRRPTAAPLRERPSRSRSPSTRAQSRTGRAEPAP